MKTIKKFLILEYYGQTENPWNVPDWHHGGIYFGPYETRDKAQKAIDCYIFQAFKGQESWYSKDFIAEMKKDMGKRHCIVEMDYPDYHPEI